MTTTPNARRCQAAGRDLAVLEIIRKHPGITSLELAEIMGDSQHTARTRLLNLKRAGLIAAWRSGRDWHYRTCDELQRLLDALAHIERIQPAALALIRKHGYVFDRAPSSEPPITGADRWEALAFSLYSDLCEIHNVCRQVLAEGAEGDQ